MSPGYSRNPHTPSPGMQHSPGSLQGPHYAPTQWGGSRSLPGIYFTFKARISVFSLSERNTFEKKC